MPELREVRSSFRSSDKVILDRNNQIIDEVRVERDVRRLAWIELNQVSPVFIEAVLTAEDKRFFYHPGFDPLAMVKAALGLVVGRPLRGASTITMQTAELMDNPSSQLKPRRGFAQKLKQIAKALVLEIKWSKSTILEAYMNLVYFRGELQGVGAASYGLFDQAPGGLTRAQSAVMAALIRAPNAEVNRVRKRACLLLRSLGTPDECTLLTESHLSYIEQSYSMRPFMRMAPHVAKRLAAAPEFSGQSMVRSTLDRQIQWVAIHSLQKQVAAWQRQNMNDGAVVVIENSTGNVLAYVGYMGPVSQAAVDSVVAMRPAGSTLKPLIYAKAIDERIVTAASVLENSPLAISAAPGIHRPANLDYGTPELITVRAALARGLNIPAVRALELLGVENFVHTMGELGFTGMSRADFYGPSLALGSVDVRLLELANAYRTLANNGVWTPLTFSPGIPSEQGPKKVFSPEAAFIIKDILSDRPGRGGTFGPDPTRFWTAVKTGNNWCVGFSERYTVAVWARNLSGEALWNISGIQVAAPVWQELMNYLHNHETSEEPRPPPGLVQSGERLREWFLSGTEPNNQLTAEVRSRFSYPLDQSLIAVDPDLPKPNHSMFIQVVAPRDNQNVYLNGRRIGRAKALLPWDPDAGRYILELKDSQGLTLDKVSFEVRGRRFASAL